VIDTRLRITVIPDGAEHGLDDHAEIAAELADQLGISEGDVVVDSVRPSMGGAWVAVRLFAPITNRLPDPTPSGKCRACKRPFSPTHDINAPGPTTQHPFTPQATR
jgi:hypothetical protein